jgi:hypothetical protein
MNVSEVALLRARIDCEIEALQRLRHGFAQVADHETIMYHYRVLDVCHAGLAAEIGEAAAMDILYEGINRLI